VIESAKIHSGSSARKRRFRSSREMERALTSERASSVLLATELANEGVKGRREEKAEAGYAQHSEQHRCAQRLPHLRACSGRNGEWATPKMNERDVIRIGRRRVRAACTAASPEATPSSSFWRANSTIRMAFLAAKADENDEADLRQDVSMGMPRASMPVPMRAGTSARSGRLPNGSFQLSYCATRTRKTKRAAVPKTRRVGVPRCCCWKARSVPQKQCPWEELGGQAPPCDACRTSGDTRRRYPLHLGGRKKIVARHAVWDRFTPELRHCPNRHHFTGCVGGPSGG